MKKPLVGISACLLGEKVRYDGGHKKDKWLLEKLAPFVEWVPICPEMEMGLGSPREPMRLERSVGGAVQLKSVKSKVDLTSLGKDIATSLAKSLPENLNGFIFKNRSPSCGLEKVKVYDLNGIPQNVGVGFFARAVLDRFPFLPVVEEGHLCNLDLKEHFLIRLYAHRALSELSLRMSDLQKFHQRYKYILMAHDEALFRKLGPIAANSSKMPVNEVFSSYRSLFLQAISRATTDKKRLNVVQHIYGYVKNEMPEKKKQSVLKKIDKFQRGEIPFVAILTLLDHLVEEHSQDYLAQQSFFRPYPEGLKL